MKYHILMGDVVGSSRLNAGELQCHLKCLIDRCKQALADEIESPYTITLGDEFQGIARSLKGTIRAIFFLEEEILRRKYEFKLHYVAVWGEIRTAINPEIAYEMMGPGLTRARSMLTSKHRTRPRFAFEYRDDRKSEVLNNLFYIVERIIGRWKLRDFKLISEMIEDTSNSAVALRQNRDRSLIWRRRETLRVEEYTRVKQALFNLANYLDNEDDMCVDRLHAL